MSVKGDLSFEIADKLSRDLDTLFDNKPEAYKDFGWITLSIGFDNFNQLIVLHS